MVNRKTRILVVDDEEAMREVLEMRMEGWGFEVRSACDGHQAQELARSYCPDIIISDVIMPELSGLDLLRETQIRWRGLSRSSGDGARQHRSCR